jgi:non-specific serine/threonine protein kinase
MRRWHLIPVALVVALAVGLPLAALTDTGVEHELRRSLGLSTGECVPMTNLASDWSEGADLPYDLDEPRAATLDGEVYLVGGITGLERLARGRLLLEPSNELTRFDPWTETFVARAPLPRRLSHISVVAHGHELFVLGGYGRTLDANTSKAFYRYSPGRDRWSRMPDMPAPRAAMAAGVVGDRLIVAGGARDNVPLADAFAFDFHSRRWTRLPDMPSRREHVGAAVVGDTLYVLGGRTPGSFAADVAESYDVSDREWKPLPPMPTGSGGLGVVSAGGEVIAVGGGNDEAGTVTGAVQRWDPRAQRWSLLPAMRTPRHGQAVVRAAGKVWVFGGSPCAYFNATDSVESLDLRAG